MSYEHKKAYYVDTSANGHLYFIFNYDHKIVNVSLFLEDTMLKLKELENK